MRVTVIAHVVAGDRAVRVGLGDGDRAAGAAAVVVSVTEISGSDGARSLVDIDRSGRAVAAVDNSDWLIQAPNAGDGGGRAVRKTVVDEATGTCKRGGAE